MSKLSSLLGRLLKMPTATDERAETGWILDPLQHPEIAVMDMRKLGDLPLPGPFPRVAPCRGC